MPKPVTVLTVRFAEWSDCAPSSWIISLSVWLVSSVSKETVSGACGLSFGSITARFSERSALVTPPSMRTGPRISAAVCLLCGNCLIFCWFAAAIKTGSAFKVMRVGMFQSDAVKRTAATTCLTDRALL